MAEGRSISNFSLLFNNSPEDGNFVDSLLFIFSLFGTEISSPSPHFSLLSVSITLVRLDSTTLNSSRVVRRS